MISNTIKKTNLYIIAGGLGKCILFSSLISKLAKRDKNKISIMCPQPFIEVFLYHKAVQNVIPLHTDPNQIMDYKLKDYVDNITYIEPYYSEYWYHETHIINCFEKLCNLDISAEPDKIPNEVYTILENQDYVKKLKETIEGPYIILQLEGGTAPGVKKEYHDSREYRNKKEIVDALLKNFPKHWVIIVSTDQHNYDAEIFKKHRVAHIENENILSLVAAIKNADSFVSIDSMVPHAAFAFDKRVNGICLWNTTTPISLGHAGNINLQSEKLASVDVPVNFIIDNLGKIINE